MIPENPIILLSFINCKLRDEYKSLDDLCEGLDISKDDLINKLSEINYQYDLSTNQFK